MHNKAVRKLYRLPRTIYGVIMAVLIFSGLLTVITAALVLISAGIITIPSALIRIVGKGGFFVSDLSPVTMLFSGGFMLFFGVGLLLWTACRISPAAGSYIFRVFTDNIGK